MKQYGFFIDLSRCIGCNACVISCKQWHDIPPGPVKWMRVHQWEKGSFPNIDLRVLPINCLHCDNPACLDACPNKAIAKEEKYGAVLVDPQKCTGARKCFEACPYGAPQFEDDKLGSKMSKCTMCMDRLEDGLAPLCVLSCSLRALEFGPIDELMKKYGLRQLEELPGRDAPPCKIACPAGVKAGGYVRHIADGNIDKAMELFRETAPFAGVLGRVCTHPCEIDCNRGQFDDAVSICSLKRYMADEYKGKKAISIKTTKESKIAVIGAGPAGLACAYDLVKQGYPVTVFEANAEAGGLMRYGIPGYRLPKKVLDSEISYIKDLGVDIKTGTKVKKIDELFGQGYKAVFVATGTWASLKLGVPGEDAAGVIYAIDFLRKVNSGEKVKIGKKVTVVGGGSVAIDAARTALRLGAGEVHLVCLECRDMSSMDRMLAQEVEINEAEEEGVIIHPCLGIKSVKVGNGKVTGLETMECVSVRESDGRFAPKFGECEAPVLETDMVIAAIGQTLDKSMLPEGLEQAVKSDPLTLETAVKGVFSGGDMVYGPSDIISAIAAGKQAAESITRYLDGEDMRKGRKIPVKSARARVELKSQRPRVLDIKKRKSFAEVDLGFERKAAMEQAERCLKCGSTVPSVVFRRVMPKKQIVPWNADRALELWQKRHPDKGGPLPDIFTKKTDITDVPEDVYGRGKLVLKPKTREELMWYTTDDE
jgi:DMSO reductase iron-sulfur subunit